MFPTEVLFGDINQILAFKNALKKYLKNQKRSFETVKYLLITSTKNGEFKLKILIFDNPLLAEKLTNAFGLSFQIPLTRSDVKQYIKAQLQDAKVQNAYLINGRLLGPISNFVSIDLRASSRSNNAKKDIFIRKTKVTLLASLLPIWICAQQTGSNFQVNFSTSLNIEMNSELAP